MKTDLNHHGLSAELLGLLDALRETPGLNGVKFRPSETEAVARHLLCRNYGFRCLELAHLLYAVARGCVDQPAAPILSFFWVDECVTPARFRAAFENTPEGSNIRLGKEFLTIDLGANVFHISPTRSGELAAWLELLVNIDPTIIEHAETTLADGRSEAVAELANHLQALLYAYLSEHAQPAQQQRRFRVLWQWLMAERNDARADLVDDQVILDFWQTAAQADYDSLGFRRYRSVAEDFFALRQALAATESSLAVARAASIGGDHEAGEVSPEILADALELTEQEVTDFAWLASAPKFVTAKTLEAVSNITMLGVGVRYLPLTALRHALMGDWQARLIQATRNHKGLAEALASGPAENYATQLEALHDVDESLESTEAATLHILLQLQSASGLAWLLEAIDDDARRSLLASLGDVNGAELLLGREEADEAFDEDSVTELDTAMGALASAFFSQLPSLRLQNPEVNALLQRCEKAFKGVNREGFKQLPERSAASAYVRGLDGLGELRAMLGKARKSAVAQLSPDAVATEKFAADLSIFTGVFTHLYGGDS